MKQRHAPKQSFIALLLCIIALVVIVLGAVIFMAFRGQTPTLFGSTQPFSNPNAAETIELTGKVTQGPLQPVCYLNAECYRAVTFHTVQAVDSTGVAGKTKTDDKGVYKLKLKPGHYTLELVPQVDAYHLMNNEIDLSTSNKSLDLTLDSNIR